MATKRASISSTPRNRRVLLLRWTVPEWESVQRQVFLSPGAAHKAVERIRQKGGDAVLFAADVGEWTTV